MDKIVVSPLEKAVMLPLVRWGRRFWALVAALSAVIAWGVYAFTVQLRDGLAVTGMNNGVPWGLYITTFVFFIGVSYGGTLVSAVLRLVHAEWRKPITRLAEATTAFALLVSAALIAVDVGRPERIGNLLWFGRVESPLIWDLLSVVLYLVASLIFLFLPLIPDLATLRDKMPRRLRTRRWLYRKLAAHWHNLPEQRRVLEKGIAVMSVLVIPLAVSAHTVTAWIFGMTLRPGWHTALLGPLFVIGAIFSGIATVILVMAAFRRAYRLQSLITPEHFRNLGLLLLVLDIILIYLTLNEYLTAGFQAESSDVSWLTQLSQGPYAPMFWAMVLAGFLAPALILVATRARSVPWTIVASVLVNVGMWFERFLIVVPTLATPQMPVPAGLYWPSWVEWSIMAAAFAAFTLFLALFSKLFPVVSMWEAARKAPRPGPERAPGVAETRKGATE